jgi:hypothetical protein
MTINGAKTFPGTGHREERLDWGDSRGSLSSGQPISIVGKSVVLLSG